MGIQNYTNSAVGNKIVVYADKRIYSKSVILKCLYWYGGQFHTNLTLEDESTFKIVLEPLHETQDNFELIAFQQKLERDLVDFHLREIVAKETKNVRDLLIAKAFAHAEELMEPLGEISDPVGFDKDRL